MNKWDAEYSRRGIPSSFRDDPSGVLTWALDNWPYLTDNTAPKTAVDIGCGTGRNAIYMASSGIEVLAFDSSEAAVKSAQVRLADNSLTKLPTFLKHDLTDGIPAKDRQIDFAVDIFVYKHQLLPSVRKAYRQELHRILQPDGRLLISLAGHDDGYYDACPDLEVAESGNPRTIMDPVAVVGSVLFSLEELIAEMADLFFLEMAWHKSKIGMMHQEYYLRHTLATIWHPKEEQDGTA
ncbi:MAG: class I SAM-dependent methyltransferase [Pyrinomonadaceae bacterium]